MWQLSENSRLGFRLVGNTLHQGFGAGKYLIGIGDTASVVRYAWLESLKAQQQMGDPTLPTAEAPPLLSNQDIAGMKNAAEFALMVGIPDLGEIGAAGLLGKAGSYADLTALAEKGDAIVAHHMPQAALGFTSKAEGGALAITSGEHVATRTFGFKGAMTAAADAGKSFRGVLANDIRDIRSIAGSKYNEGLKSLIQYFSTNFPNLMSK
jgi:hypothetical protein